MQTRHRIPTIFNLSMVDVLCCALGCVILLWLINFREAKRRAASAGATAQELKLAHKDVASARKRGADLQASLDRERTRAAGAENRLAAAESRLASVQADLAATVTKHAGAVASLRDAKGELARLVEAMKGLEAKAGELSVTIAARDKEHAELLRRMAAAQKALALVEKDRDASKVQLVQLNSKVQDLSGQLLISSDLVRKLRKAEEALKLEAKGQLDKLAAVDARVTAMRAELDRSKEGLTEAERRVLELLAANTKLEEKRTLDAKALAAALASLASLRQDNKQLTQQIDLARLQLNNRFAGLELTGRKVVFVIDTSGSMKMDAFKKINPQKWGVVCDTVEKVFRSLQGVTHYQVITFADSFKYLRGNEAEWFNYDPGRSPPAVMEALRKIDPDGGTKMGPALGEAFRFRAKGLETVYLISDGLPTDDDGLSPEAQRLEGVALTTYLSNRLRQKLRTDWNAPEGGRVVRVNTIGVYFDSPEVGSFLWALARENDGNFVGMSRP